MTWRSIMIQNPAKINLQQGQIKITNDDGIHTLPIEDITALILESPQITLSSSILSFCQDNGVAVITCDRKHMPNGMLLPFQPHSRQSRVAHIQISISESFKKRLWQRVIQRKITNQADCLENITGKKESLRLYALSKQVASGDIKNIEAQAARYYWPKLMGNDFKRSHGNIINSALDYSYTVLRAFVARSQVSYGLLPTFGIHHCNDLNAFNLTDDMIEVFRPFADNLVCDLINQNKINNEETSLSTKIRQELANIGNLTCKINDNIHTIANACDIVSSSLVNAMEQKKLSLLILPKGHYNDNQKG